MRTLDQETADLLAATAVRLALERAPELHFTSVDATVKALYWAALLDFTTAAYVGLHSERFCCLPAPTFIEASWHLAADSQLADAGKTSSAHPFFAS